MMYKSLGQAVVLGSISDVNQHLKFEDADFPYGEEMHNNTSIHLASYNKLPDKLNILIESLSFDNVRLQKALNNPNLYGATPLHEAVWIGKPPHIYEKESSQGQLSKYKKEYYRRLSETPRTVRLLLEKGANPLSEEVLYPSGDFSKKSFSILEFISYQKTGRDESSKEFEVLTESEKLINSRIVIQEKTRNKKHQR